MAKGKYNDEAVRRCCEAIAESGRDIDGYLSAGIAEHTFYRWINEKEPFRQAVEAAKEQFREMSLPQLRVWARKGLRNTLKAVADGDEIVTTTTQDAINPQTGEIISLTTVQRRPAMIPIQQAFTYVMGSQADLISWVRQGVDLGIFSIQFLEETIGSVDEAANRIRSAIENGIPQPDPGSITPPAGAIASALGLFNTAPISEKMDRGSVEPQAVGEV